MIKNRCLSILLIVVILSLLTFTLLSCDKKPTDYTINVKFNASSDEVFTMIYNPETGYSTEKTRKYYTISSLIYNDNTYTYDAEKKDYFYNQEALSSIIVDNNGIDATAVWTCEIFGIILNIIGWYENIDEVGRWHVKADNANGEHVGTEIDIDYWFDDGEDGTDFNEFCKINLYEMFNNKYTNYTKLDGTTPVTYTGNAQVWIGSYAVSLNFQCDDNFTFEDFYISALSSNFTPEEIAGHKISIRFMYE